MNQVASKTNFIFILMLTRAIISIARGYYFNVAIIPGSTSAEFTASEIVNLLIIVVLAWLVRKGNPYGIGAAVLSMIEDLWSKLYFQLFFGSSSLGGFSSSIGLQIFDGLSAVLTIGILFNLIAYIRSSSTQNTPQAVGQERPVPLMPPQAAIS